MEHSLSIDLIVGAIFIMVGIACSLVYFPLKKKL